MSDRVWRTAIERAGRLASPLALDDFSDADLLKRFHSTRDDAAFAAVVRRHGPLVWSVCRGNSPSEADAEDAFQATFVVLVRNSSRVRSLGPWLHTVAGRVCRNAHRARARRRKHERTAAVSEADRPVGDTAWERWQGIAHEEIERLPATLRTPFVLCVLQGVRQPDAAKQLGWKLGTVSGRVCKAKQVLADALDKRGVGAAAVVALGSAAVPVGASLTGKATAAVTGIGIEAHVQQLARGAMGGIMVKGKFLAAAIVAGTLAVGAGTQVLPKAEGQFPGGGAGAPPAGQGGPGAPPGAGAGPAAAPPVAGGGPGGLMPGMGGGMSGMDTFGPRVEYEFVAKPNSADAFKDLLRKRGSAGWEFAGYVPGDAEMIFMRSHLRGGFMGQGSGNFPAMGGPGGMGMGGSATMPGPGGGGSGFFPKAAGSPGGPGASLGGDAGPVSGSFGPRGGGASRPVGPGSGAPSGPPAGVGVPGAGGGIVAKADPVKPVALEMEKGEKLSIRSSSSKRVAEAYCSNNKILEVTSSPKDASRLVLKAVEAGEVKVEIVDVDGKRETLAVTVK